MTISPLVYTIVLAHNHLETTLRSLESLSAMVNTCQRIVLVDNGSTDGTCAVVAERFPAVELLAHSTNLGFSAGMNLGLRRALQMGADFALLANNDVTTAPALLEHLLSAVSPDVGAAAPIIYYARDRQRIWSAGFRRDPLLLEMRGGARGQMDRQCGRATEYVDYLLGCVLLLRCSALRKIGLFDERYYFYYEDMDLSIRIQDAGYRLITVPAAKAWHEVAGSAGQGSAFQIYHRARSSVIFARCHARGLQRPACVAFRGGSAILASIRLLWRRQPALLKSYWQGIRDGCGLD
jgi:GT2 family glycosyltransferase